jgi:outer membrane protein OmpA-like peptidoglycan-associated protein
MLLRVRTSPLVFFFGLLFFMVIQANAQNRALPELYVNPRRTDKPEAIIPHPVNGIFGVNYYYDITAPSGLRVREIRQIKPVSITQDEGGDLAEERFITTDSALYTQSRYNLYIRWDYKDQGGDLCDDGEYLIRIFETRGLAGAVHNPRYEYRVIIDTQGDDFDIELATTEISKNANGIMLARAVSKNSGGTVYAKKWGIKIKDKESGEIIHTASLESSSPNGVIPLEYSWFDFSSIDKIGTYNFVIEVTNQDRAGNLSVSDKGFAVLYEIDHAAENQKLQEMITALQNTGAGFQGTMAQYISENQKLKETITGLQSTLQSTMTAEQKQAEQKQAEQKPFNSPYGERFNLISEAFGGTLEIQGEFNEEKRGFDFAFSYKGIPEDAAVTSIAADVYGKNGRKIGAVFSADLSSAEWKGLNDAGAPVITSNSTYRFDFIFENLKSEVALVSGRITTTLVTEEKSNNEHLVLLPDIFFPGFETNILRTGSFLSENMNSIWKAAAVLNRYADRYESLIIRGYANYTTYPNRTRMIQERSTLLRYSRQRAESVRDLLLFFDVPPEKIKIEGMGWNDQVVLPNSRDNFKNRRIELYLKYKEQ